MTKHRLIPIVALLGGGVGFGLRKWQLATAFEADTGLALKGAPATAALLAWSAVMAVLLVALCWKRREPCVCEDAFSAEGNSLVLTACVLSGFLLLISAGSEAVTLMAGYQASLYTSTSWTTQFTAKFLPPLQVLLCLGGFLSVLLWTRRLARTEENKRESMALLELCLLFCVWLISDYQSRAADPVVQDYLYEILAIAAGVMALYYIAGYSFQNGYPRRTAVSCLLAVYFSMVSMADGHELADLLRFGFAVLFFTAHAWMLLSGETGNRLSAEEVPTEEIKEADENV